MLSAKEIDVVAECYASHGSELLEFSELTEAEKQLYAKLESSFLLAEYHDMSYYKTYKLKACAGFANIILVKVMYKIRNGKYEIGGSDLQVIGIKLLPEDYGNIIIRPETIADKIAEFFSRTEIDFNNFPVFSSKYYMLAENENRCYSFATPQRLMLIENQNEISVQVSDRLLMAKFSRMLNQDDFRDMIEFVVNM